METRRRGLRRSAVVIASALAAVLAATGAPALAAANPGVAVFPAMDIYQGGVGCLVGFVEPQMRIALSIGQCNHGSIVTDSRENVVGAVMLARRNTGVGSAADATAADAEYEVIKLAHHAIATDQLPNGRQLQSVPGFSVQPALPVCHVGISTGQSCGRLSSVSASGLVIADMAADQRDLGGPVYVLTDDNHAVIVGMLDGVQGAISHAQSWQAVMRQLYLDTRSLSSPQPILGRALGS